jgi:uncharacterized YigZ family protein
MKTVTKENIYETVINKSRFISYLAPIQSTEEAKTCLANLKALYPDATHHVSAFIIGPGGENGRYNDDGEPSGTAGLPVFDVLRKNNLTNCICVVIRYFGGIKLGAGGLVRAYSKSASENVKSALIVPIIDYQELSFSFSYRFINDVEQALSPYQITDKTFSDIVKIQVKVPSDKTEELIELLNEKTLGQIMIKKS